MKNLLQAAFIAGVLVMQPIFSQPLTDAQIDALISRMLAERLVAYKLDLSADKARLGALDVYFQKNAGVKNIPSVKEGDEKTSIVTVVYKENKPIFLEENSKAGPITRAETKGRYLVSAHSRTFSKNISAPAESIMPKERAIELAKQFVVRNKLVVTTQSETFNPLQVVSRIRAQADQKEKRIYLGHLVVFERLIQGVPVANSKISIELHPQNGELISFRNRHWTSIDEKGAVNLPAASLAKVRSQIDSALTHPDGKRDVVKSLEKKWFVADKLLVPVLSISIEPVGEHTEPDGQEPRTLYIPLIDSPLDGGKTGKLRTPVKAG